jgi:hypothetical protein
MVLLDCRNYGLGKTKAIAYSKSGIPAEFTPPDPSAKA